MNEKVRPGQGKQDKLERILDREPLLIRDGVHHFVASSPPVQSSDRSLTSRLKAVLKRHGRLYYLLFDLISPVRRTRAYRGCLRGLLEKHGREAVILNYGSGSRTILGRRDIINADLAAFPGVDLTFDTELPLTPGSVDLVLCLAVLEHLPDPERALNQIKRCLKPGGDLLVLVPFIQAFHAAPHDYYRFTSRGAGELLEGFEKLESGLGSGPASGFLWIFQEWLALTLSFGLRPLKEVLCILLMGLTWPLKYLDLLLERYPGGEGIAGGFYVRARKPGRE